MSISIKIKQLVDYAVAKKLITEEDRIYSTNLLLAALGEAEYVEPEETVADEPLEDILGALCDHAAEKGLLESNSVVYRDLFDTMLMGLLTPRPSEVIRTFRSYYSISPKLATDYFYELCRNSD